MRDGSRGEHGTPDSAWSEAEGAGGASGRGSSDHPLPPNIQRSPQICSLQLHSTVRWFAPREVDHLLHGGQIKF